MKILKIYPSSIDERLISYAAATMRDGGIIIYPTDTLYAIGCDALSAAAVRRVCAIKEIDTRRELLSIVCASLSQASEYARIDNAAFRAMKGCLPGPFTFILPASPKMPKEFKGRHEVGIRVPDNAIARALAEELGHPLLSTSITFDEEYPQEATDPDSIALRYNAEKRIDMMIDGGEGLAVGSTVVSLINPLEPEILRQGVGDF